MTTSGQVTSGQWAALLVGMLLLLTLVAITTAGIMRVHRHTKATLQPADELADLSPSGISASLWRCQALIAEAVIVRQRLSGDIDAETYQIRMNELARQAISERRPQRNA